MRLHLASSSVLCQTRAAERQACLGGVAFIPSHTRDLNQNVWYKNLRECMVVSCTEEGGVLGAAHFHDLARLSGLSVEQTVSGILGGLPV